GSTPITLQPIQNSSPLPLSSGVSHKSEVIYCCRVPCCRRSFITRTTVLHTTISLLHILLSSATSEFLPIFPARYPAPPPPVGTSFRVVIALTRPRKSTGAICFIVVPLVVPPEAETCSFI